MMKQQPYNAITAPEPVGNYVQALEVSGATRRLYVSGQIPATRAGAVPAGFQAQAELVWQNLAAQLTAANMTVANLVKVTIFLSDRKYAMDNRVARKAALGDYAPAMTVIITGIFDEAWLLEIEGIAEA
jgi:2-iminobutanoate/2-iminopropanoate deaminase